YSSLRPLVAETGLSATATSREHRIWETPDGVLHISGGKYTTYREMSEELVDTLLRDIAPGRDLPCRTASTALNVITPPKEITPRVRLAVEREYARKLQDVLYVSTYWGHERHMTREWLEPIAREMGSMLSWSEDRIQSEVSTCLAQQELP
ncbi:MAG: glycerol-3-phosphate dehydrogenase, partial [Bryobacterales bacterium]|nr:glycerol-3-phosphate dehydrogenase [Bryobacterales bacterium]